MKITNGEYTFEVTKGAYHSIFEKQGYNLVDLSVESSTGNSTLVIEQDMSLNLLEKPISEWKKSDVKQFARDKGINLAGTKSVNEAKEIIKVWIAENL